MGAVWEESMMPAMLAGAEDAVERRPAAPLLPAEVLGWFNEGLERLTYGDAISAIALFEKAIEQSPSFSEGHMALGVAYALDYRIYPALDHLERAVSLDPSSFAAHFKLGQLCFKLRIPQKGYAEMAQALDCSTTLDQRKMVGELLREEKKREAGGYARPWWNKPFSRVEVALAAVTLCGLLAALLVYVR